MAATVPERVELVKLCRSKDWSKAIRLLDSLLAQSCNIQDICNRAHCYSQLELHKHVIKDCDKALQLDPALLQAYILKGRALLSLGRKEEAVRIWQRGHQHALHQSADLRQLLELEDLLVITKQTDPLDGQRLASESSSTSHNSHNATGLDPIRISENSFVCNGSNGNVEPFIMSSKQIEVCVESTDVITKEKFDDYPNGIHEKFSNGSSGVDYKLLADTSEICCELKNTSAFCEKTPIGFHESVDTCEGDVRPDNKFPWSDVLKKRDKYSVARTSPSTSINVDFRLSRGIAQVNEGNYAQGINIFEKILQENPTYLEALVGRGTAYAFQRELVPAIADFSKAIQLNPSAGEAWKRRGQARAAMGESAEAIADLTKALEFEEDSADILHERGIVHFKFKDFNAAVIDLSASVKLDKFNKSAYTFLGLSLSSLGQYSEAQEAHLKAIRLDQSFLEAWTHLAQLYQDLANSEKALECVRKILQIDSSYAKAYHLRGLFLHGIGDHRNAIKELSFGLSLESTYIECLYLRASCYHANGEYKEAVKDYDAVLDLELDSVDKFVLQCLAFYQKEIALYTASKINIEFCWFDVDGDIDPLFKEYWCKRSHPKNVCQKVYRQPPLRESLRKAKLKKLDFALNKQKTVLLQAADNIGKKFQYHSLGFLSNKRQHRMAGLAAIEVAQKVSKVWRTLQSERRQASKGTTKSLRKARRKDKLNPASHNRGGVGCSSSFSETSPTLLSEERSYGRPTLSWHEVYNLAVKWRQISEPCDPVVWVNKLGEEFNTGFGSRTPLVLGQAKVVRYYPNFQRTLNAAKAVIKEKKYVHDRKDNIIYLLEDRKLQEIMDAVSCDELYEAVGGDFWTATWCNSSAVDGVRLEGTRITLLKMGEIGFDFSIRTPCTPARWSDFDAEMTAAWEAVCDAYCGETFGSTDFDALENVREAILGMAYYWYNFMPLSRGTAGVGFVVLLGLLLAANMEFTGSIPEGLQVDWEAILNFHPNPFINSVKQWLYPSLKMTTSWKGYPDVVSTFDTTGSVVAALSTYTD